MARPAKKDVRERSCCASWTDIASGRSGYPPAAVEFEEALERLGFRPGEQDSARGARLYRLDPNRFLTYWLHLYDDGTALFTWEFAIVDYLATKGMQVGSAEALNLFMYPMEDERGSQDAAWLAGALDRAEERLRSLRFDAPE